MCVSVGNTTVDWGAVARLSSAVAPLISFAVSGKQKLGKSVLTCKQVIVAASLVLAFSSSVRICAAGNEILTRFLRDAPLAWEELQEKYVGMTFPVATSRKQFATAEGRLAITSRMNNKIQVFIGKDLYVRCDTTVSSQKVDASKSSEGNSVLSAESKLEGSTVRNIDYVFSVGKGSSGYSVRSLEYLSDGGFPESLRFLMPLAFPGLRYGDSLVPYNLYQMSTAQTVPMQFSLKATAASMRDSLVEVELAPVSFNGEPLPEGFGQNYRGTLLLDPDHFWVVRQFDEYWESADKSSRQKTRYIAKYSDMYSFHPIQITMTATSDGTPGYQQVEETTLGPLTSHDLPEVEFRLTAFGLPEPEQVSPQFPWIGVFAVIVTLLLLLSTFVFRKSRVLV